MSDVAGHAEDWSEVGRVASFQAIEAGVRGRFGAGRLEVTAIAIEIDGRTHEPIVWAAT